MSNNHRKLDPKDIEGKILLDPNGKIVISKSDKDYILILELPDGTMEKHIFKAGFEYVVKYNKKKNTSDSRALIGEVDHIVTEFI